MLKGTKLYSVLWMKCPKCHRGNLFKVSNPYRLKSLTNMPRNCECCGENFIREPGFYFGAAYVSYGLSVALWIAVLVALMVFDAIGLISFSFFEDPMFFLTIGVLVLLISIPVLFRLSRSIWINMFTTYEKETAERVKDCNPDVGN